MHISVRAVRAIEKRAIRKLLHNPVLRQLWLDYSAGDREEEDFQMTPVEIEALYWLAQTPSEYRLVDKVLHLI